MPPDLYRCNISAESLGSEIMFGLGGGDVVALHVGADVIGYVVPAELYADIQEGLKAAVGLADPPRCPCRPRACRRPTYRHVSSRP